MVSTIKFSEFANSGYFKANKIVVGLDSGVNAQFTSALQFSPSGDTFDRPSSPVNPTIRYNTDNNVFEYWNGTAWVSVSYNNGIAPDEPTFVWLPNTFASQPLQPSVGWINLYDPAQVIYTLPVHAFVGDYYRICGESAMGWAVAMNVGQTMKFGNQATTVSIGNLISTDPGDAITIVCVVANTVFRVFGDQGNITVT